MAVVAPYMPEGRRGRPPFPVEALPRIHFMHQWFTLSDPAMEEALHGVPMFRDFAGLGGWDERLPYESTIFAGSSRAGDAPKQERQPLVLWHEGSHRS